MKIYSIGFDGAIGRKRGIGLEWGGWRFGTFDQPVPTIPRGVFDPPETSGYLDPDIGSGFPKGYEAPPLRYDPMLGGKPDDVTPWARGTWLLGPRARATVERVDAAAFDFVPVLMHWPASKTGPAREETWWLADVIRHLDALDAERTDLRITDFDNGRKSIEAKRMASQIFKAAALGSAHVFVEYFNRGRANCDEAFVQAVSADKILGFSFFHKGDVL